MELYPTAFIDRDGTINVEGGYINHPDHCVVHPFAAQAVRMLNMHGWLAVVVTNQSGIGRGLDTEDTMNAMHNKMLQNFESQGAKVDGIYFCPHTSDTKCDCRKPDTGMFRQAIKDLPVDTNRMVMIGDKYGDMQAGFNMNMRTIMVESGYGKGELMLKSHKWARQPDFTAINLLEAVKILLRY
jgi:D-glycero-D-manno-heptose 1,7-bisphosphate phosphatase